MTDTKNTSGNTEPSGKKKETLSVADLEMRDYFAAMALPRFIAHDRNRMAVSEPAEAAQRAYEYADAMLRARSA